MVQPYELSLHHSKKLNWKLQKNPRNFYCRKWKNGNFFSHLIVYFLLSYFSVIWMAMLEVFFSRKCYKTCDNTVKSPIFTFSDAIQWAGSESLPGQFWPPGLVFDTPDFRGSNHEQDLSVLVTLLCILFVPVRSERFLIIFVGRSVLSWWGSPASHPVGSPMIARTLKSTYRWNDCCLQCCAKVLSPAPWFLKRS